LLCGGNEMKIIRALQKLVPVLLVIVSIMLIIMLQFGFIFLMLALLPAGIVYFTDSDPHRNTFRTVFAVNLAATIPTLKPMFLSGLKFKHYDIDSTIADPKIWLFIYGAAIAGWCIIYVCRFVCRIVLSLQYEMSANHLARVQEKLLEEWGDPLREATANKAAK
jgi:hypothetical protein